jgi:hypothetical protein
MECPLDVLIQRDVKGLYKKRHTKDAYWGERIARLGPFEGFRVAEEPRRQALLLNAGWPDAALRQADLASHVRLAALFRRAGSTRRS